MSVAAKTNGAKYANLAAALEHDIMAGRYRPGDQLPSERQIAQTHGMTVMTVRRALGVLAGRGLIVREQGRGTFVSLPGPGRSGETPGASRGPVFLLGLSADISRMTSPVNWQTRLRRFQGIADAGFQLGLAIQSSVDFDADARPRLLVERLRRASGLLLHDELLPEAAIIGLREEGVPSVAINCYERSECCSRVQVDGRQGAFRAVRYLVSLGHERIGLVVGDAARPSMRHRLEGYLDALAVHDLIRCDDYIVVDPRGLPEDGAAAVSRLLDLPEPPTAIFTASDNRALGALAMLAERGYRVPERLSIVGFDDLHEAAASTPSLTTVANPLYESGRAAVNLLHRQIVGGNPKIEIEVLPVLLAIRESCAPPPQ